MPMPVSAPILRANVANARRVGNQALRAVGSITQRPGHWTLLSVVRNPPQCPESMGPRHFVLTPVLEKDNIGRSLGITTIVSRPAYCSEVCELYTVHRLLFSLLATRRTLASSPFRSLSIASAYPRLHHSLPLGPQVSSALPRQHLFSTQGRASNLLYLVRHITTAYPTTTVLSSVSNLLSRLEHLGSLIYCNKQLQS